MRHKFPVLTVKKWLKSVYIYGSYRKNKIGIPFFLDHPVVIRHQKTEFDPTGCVYAFTKTATSGLRQADRATSGSSNVYL